MREKVLIATVGIVTLAAAGVFASTFAHAMWYSSPDDIEVAASPTVWGDAASATATSTTGSYVLRDSGMRLRIPAIALDARVQSVGVSKSGNMAVPTNYTDVGWYRGGTKPGDIGSAVINGHVDNGFGLPAVFRHLTDLSVGSDIFIETAGGKELHFVVTDIETYAASDVPLDELFNRSDTARLNLITCAGEWLPDRQAYDHRTVVYSELMNDN
ncbi:MAG TPA: class F sortase [Candidatus Paceibacterota bacterium]|nr:class F sortase [Candidatus Paceibacterota bacterium]